MEEEADAAAVLKEEDVARPQDSHWPEWSAPIQAAWEELRDDRNVSDSGLGRIFFTAIDHYAARFDIAGSDFDNLLLFVRVIDNAYVDHVNAQRQKELAELAEKNKG